MLSYLLTLVLNLMLSLCDFCLCFH